MGDVLVAIQSVQFPNRYVRLDGTGVTKHIDGGGGLVNIGTFAGTEETYHFVINDDGTVSFKSIVFVDVFIRLDGTGVTPGVLLGSGGGVVNAQLNAGPEEKFKIHPKDDPPGTYQSVVSLESLAHPGRFLRLDDVSGVVNVQGVADTHEQFKILVVGRQ